MIFLALSTNYTQQIHISCKKNIPTTKYDTETFSEPGPKLSVLVPNESKPITSFADLKIKIKAWLSESCLCRLCKTYIHLKDFISFLLLKILGFLIKLWSKLKIYIHIYCFYFSIVVFIFSYYFFGCKKNCSTTSKCIIKSSLLYSNLLQPLFPKSKWNFRN